MRQDNIRMLHDTLEIFEKGFYQIGQEKIRLKLDKHQVETASVFLPENIQNMKCHLEDGAPHSGTTCAFSCKNMDSFSKARQIQNELCNYEKGSNEKPVLVLNLANPVNPGGGVRRGARAQEEDLCRKSSLLLSLEGKDAMPYYEYNRSLHTYMGSDAIMIHPWVEIIKDENGDLLDESVIVSVMTCAAPMLREGMEGLTQEAYESMVYTRISGMLKVAACCGYEYLVLGAFGCGAFRNDAHIVSDLFYRAIKDFESTAGCVFRRIDFAVLDHSHSRYNFREFFRNFGALSETGVCKEEKYYDISFGHAIQTVPAVYFWMDNEENGWLSNWYRSSFVIGDIRYLHIEQYMMAEKAKFFRDEERYAAILKESSPAACKKLGRKVTPFDAEAWDEVKYEIVKAGCRAKIAQNSEMKEALIKTGNALLAEASPYDKIWGIGLDAKQAAKTALSDWPGRNLMGKILMELRGEF